MYFVYNIPALVVFFFLLWREQATGYVGSEYFCILYYSGLR